MNVMNVGEPSERKPICMIIREFILEKNPILVRNVGKTSVEAQLSPNTREFICEINSNNPEIKDCTEALAKILFLLNIRGFLLERKLENVMNYVCVCVCMLCAEKTVC